LKSFEHHNFTYSFDSDFYYYNQTTKDMEVFNLEWNLNNPGISWLFLEA